MARVVRFTCGKCGNSITLVSETAMRLKEGEKSTITCEEAQTVFPSMQGCDDSFLILSKIKEEREIIKGRDILLKSFPNNDSAKMAIEARVNAEKSKEKPADVPEPKEEETEEATDPTPAPETTEETKAPAEGDVDEGEDDDDDDYEDD